MKYRKLIICILIISILLNNIYASICVTYAADTDDEQIEISEEQTSAIINDSVEVENKSSFTSRTLGFFGKVITYLIALFPITVYFVIDLVFMICDNFEGAELFYASIENILFNKISLLDINFFELENISIFGLNATTYDAKNVMRINVQNWYVTMRNIAIALLIIVLAYVAIRMAISTLAQDKAKYKKMFKYWVESFILLFLLQYIMIFVIQLNTAFLNLLDKTKNAFIDTQISKLQTELDNIKSGDAVNFKTTATVQASLNKLKNIDTEASYEEILFNKFLTKFSSGSFGEAVSNTIMLCMLIYYICKFFVLYFKRMLTIGFLIVISPLITITYSIDKLRDGQSQVFNNWIKEFMINVFIQPIHCIIYLVFIFTSLYLAEKAPAIGIIFFVFLSRGEKIVRAVIVPKLEGEMMKIGKK